MENVEEIKKAPDAPPYVSRIMELKDQAEAAMKLFMDSVKELNEMGFKCHGNHDGTVFIFRDKREGYGELKRPPQQPPHMNGQG